MMNFFQRKKNSEPSQVRQVGSAAPTLKAAAPVASHVPAMRAPIETDVKTVAEAGNWNSVLAGFVSEQNRDYCAVLDLGLSTVRVLATIQHHREGAYQTMMQQLKAQHLSVEQSLTATRDVIRELYRQAEERRAVITTRGNEAQHTQLFDDLMRQAFRLGATDVHITLNREANRAAVRLRIFGRMRDWKSFEFKVIEDAVSAAFNAKSEAGTNSGGSFTLKRGMNTMTAHTIDNKKVKGRFSSYPTITGAKIVVRLLETGAKTIPSLAQLGYEASQIRQIEAGLAKNSGLIAIAGTTGSGKSTTLRNFITVSLPNASALERYSIEDPAEYDLPGVEQITIQRGPDDPEDVVDAKFMSALRQLLRLDPDVVMIGEIRDRESAQIASEMVQTGHRVMTTVHGDGALDVLSRATGAKLGMSPEIIATKSFLSALMYQKLMPVLCPHCRVPAEQVLPATTQHLLRTKYQLDPSTMYCANDAGCAHCRIPGIEGSGGTKGLTVVAEVVTPTPEILACVREKDWRGAEHAWRSLRTTAFDDADMTGKTAFEHALFKAATGVIDPRDIERDFDAFDAYRIFERTTPDNNIVNLKESKHA